MKNTVAECIRRYIEIHYDGGLIGISDLAEYCGQSEGDIYVELLELSQSGEIEIIKRFFCPEGHSIISSNLPFCEDCNFSYSNLYITTIILIQPLKHSSMMTSLP
jgi:hypothetical protein